ncbi:polysaccharide lyase family 7 protein [Kaistella flava (ex Peng et al. 2021)]|uniref:Polysaccharide lyase family 7 protein n=1 Tax=Kaistella flava (ex Peng et al. 2021) TaxID=2038776 RepID=A0A7M2Y8E7_9FLAO|nr:polysaccharide lyase family 7 protein [Kaistella flava (ex Peng et al. 2021)]QOW10421.1 polysaccharide lyase family 7 protein [Kaistella flava (ex Peng et al. 2021)]
MKFVFFITMVLITLNSCSRAESNFVHSTIEPALPVTGYANINLSNWKVTLPVDVDNNGSPDEYSAAQLRDGGYRSLSAVKPFMYDDPTDQSLVFYTYPGTSTSNSDYSRTELREMINPINSKLNWTLTQGGIMEGKLKMVSITPDASNSGNNFHRVIVMQIHGIISTADMEKYGFTSNSAPPLLKIFWIDGRIKAYKKTLVNSNTTGVNLYSSSSSIWTDISHDFGVVGNDPFTLKIVASTGKLAVTLNGSNTHVFEDISLTKWPFENYFKAGNYLITTDPAAKSILKYYQLNVIH